MGSAATTFGKATGVLIAFLVVFASSARAADDWWPHSSSAKWQYSWSDSVYSPTPTTENVSVAQSSGNSFTLQWAANGVQPPSAVYSLTCAGASGPPDVGVVSFQDTTLGITNTNWEACPPPSADPILCANPTNCSNSVASTMFDVIWGSRTPVLSEPVLQGSAWVGQGGPAQPIPTSSSTLIGVQRVLVPAFPSGVNAAVVRSQITQAGALGDPYGSGTRTTWWVYGVGPVKVVFDHSGGGAAAVTSAVLTSTNQSPLTPPPDQNYFPLHPGTTATYKWTNTKPRFSRPVVEQMSVLQGANNTESVAFKSISGPIKIISSRYLFTLRLNTGLTNTYGQTSARSLVTFPTLGHHRHFLTPLDLLTFGFNPVLPAYPANGNSWRSGNAVDFGTYGVKGKTTIVGIRTIRVPAGRFQALEVRSVLTQRGYPFGSGVRTCWFAPGRGLVKLVFRHRNGGVSTVRLVK